MQTLGDEIDFAFEFAQIRLDVGEFDAYAVDFPIKVYTHNVGFTAKGSAPVVDFSTKGSVHGVDFPDKFSTQVFNHAPDQPHNANTNGNGCQDLSHAFFLL